MTILAFLSILNTFGFSSKADTIDYWHVYYNAKKIKELTYYTDNVITIKSATIKATDSISVFFYRDTHCGDCEINLIVDDIEDAQVVKSTGMGIGNALRFPLTELVSYQQRTGKSQFQVSYFDKLNIYQAKKQKSQLYLR